MGLIFSRFYDKPSTRDTLEKIEQEIQNIEERRWDKIKREQFAVQILSFIPIAILIATVCILIYPSDSSWRDKLLLCVPITVLNLVFWVCRKVVQWYSRWSLDNEEARLRKLRKEKKRILEMVCETESYRVAAELLEKYDPKQLRRHERTPPQRPLSPLNTTLTKVSASPITTTSRQTHNQPPQPGQNPLSFLNQSISFPVQVLPQIPAPPPPTPMTKPAKKTTHVHNTTITSPHNASIVSPVVAASSVQGRPVRPILSKDRTLFEKLVDWVVADGPDNRFALICRYCYGHNGMSLAEEYETINFRCCYCYSLNTATNKRHQLHDQLQPEREKSEQAAESASEGDKTVNKERDSNGVDKNEAKLATKVRKDTGETEEREKEEGQEEPKTKSDLRKRKD